MMLVIRCAAMKDSEAITALTIELGYSVSIADTSEWLHALLNASAHAVLVAVHEIHGLCGWIHVEKRLSLESGYKAEISGLVVSAKARRMGVGKQLIAAAEQWASHQHLANVYVRSNIIREDSHPFYVSQGYTLKKTSHTYDKKLS
jgi:GNAT superfamily N-acetyltransferase